MLAPAPSSRPGMGALVYSEGVAFRVWAPHATAVAIAGTFNDWSSDGTPLAPEGNGYWSVDVPGAAAGHEYRYVVTNGNETFWRTDPYARDTVHSNGNAIIVRGDDFDWGGESGFRTPSLDATVVYEMHIGTFNDHPDDRPGTIRSVVEKLGHLEELGINAIQIMPVGEFAGAFSWGYNPAFIFAIETDYGGPDALKELIREAHRRGIAVIFDVVYNHLGPSDLDLWRFDGWGENGKGGIYFYNDWRSTTPWGDTRPDYGRREVRQYLRDNALMWLEEFRADGLRWDMTAYIRNVHGNDNDPANDIPDGWGLTRWINEEIKARQPWKFTIAEDMKNNPWITKDVGAGGAGFDAQWDAPFVHTLRAAIIPGDDAARSMAAVRDAIVNRYSPNPFERVIYTESHDEVANGRARVPHDIWPDNPGSYFSRKRSTLGAAIVFTAPGVPMILQGQEFLEDEWFRDTDPIDWGKKDRYREIFRMYQDLIRLRLNREGTTRGLIGHHVSVHHVNDNDNDKVLAFHRWRDGGPGDDVVVVANFANRARDRYAVGFPRGGRWRLRFNGDWRGYGDDFGGQPSGDVEAQAGSYDGCDFRADLSIGPYTALIFSQDRG
jgi:1,4-alpha-glucan branching enzyme